MDSLLDSMKKLPKLLQATPEIEQLELENLKLTEKNEFLQENQDILMARINSLDSALKRKEEEILDCQRKQEILDKELGAFLQNNKKLDEQLSLSNHNFALINKRTSFYEKENQSLSSKILLLEKENAFLY